MHLACGAKRLAGLGDGVDRLSDAFVLTPELPDLANASSSRVRKMLRSLDHKDVDKAKELLHSDVYQWLCENPNSPYRPAPTETPTQEPGYAPEGAFTRGMGVFEVRRGRRPYTTQLQHPRSPTPF